MKKRDCFCHEQSWFPKTCAGPELAEIYSSELGDLRTLCASSKLFMKVDLADYPGKIVRLVLEVPALRRRMLWFLDDCDKPKPFHFELGFEGDGFPPESFELIVHLFNLGSYCEHQDLHFTLLGGELDEKGPLLNKLLSINNDGWKAIKEDGLAVSFRTFVWWWWVG